MRWRFPLNIIIITVVITVIVMITIMIISFDTNSIFLGILEVDCKNSLMIMYIGECSVKVIQYIGKKYTTSPKKNIVRWIKFVFAKGFFNNFSFSWLGGKTKTEMRTWPKESNLPMKSCHYIDMECAKCVVFGIN